MPSAIKIEDLGYDEFFESQRKELGLDGFPVARIASENRGSYEAVNETGRFLARVTGRKMFGASSREDYPAVGDWVAITDLGHGQAVIEAILPRKTVIKRSYGRKDRSGNKREMQIIGTNIDAAFLVESVNRDYSLNRFERYLSIIHGQNIKPIIVLNKTDLASREELEEIIIQIKERFDDIDVIVSSALREEGIKELKEHIERGKTYCFLGSSGVGKSSLINKLLGEAAAKTGDISGYSGRGRHVTTSREMYFLESGGVVIDNPGIREVGLEEASADVEGAFDEIAELGRECKFSDCTHVSEPGCAVLEALREGRLNQNKYDNYISLRKEADYSDLSDLEKREKDRRFGKFLKKAKDDLEKYE